MRNRLVIGLVAAGLLIVALTLTIGHHDREPLFRGQSLTVWLTNVHSSRIEDSEALSAIGTNAIPFLIKALAAKESHYAKCLRLYGSNLPALLLKRLPRGRTRMDAEILKSCAIQALMAFGPRAESARSALLAALEDESPMNQLLILQTLLNLGPSAKSIPILVQTWRRAIIAEDPKAALSPRAFTAETLVTLLGQSAPLAPNAVVPALLEALDNPNQQLRLIALRYFKSPAVLTPEATVRLFALLTNADFDTRQGAFEALDSIGRTNQNLLPLVQAHLADRRTAVRATAARVLWKITGETSQSVAVLRTMVENQSGHRAAAHYLADMGAAAEPAVGSLIGFANYGAIRTAHRRENVRGSDAKRTLFRLKAYSVPVETVQF